MTDQDIREAHRIIKNAGSVITRDQMDLLLSVLPPLPKQKTLEEIAWDLHFAWTETVGNDWKEELFGDLESWLSEQHNQLRDHLEGVKSQAHPALPAGMRLADHEQYGRCVVSPATNSNGECLIFVLTRVNKSGASWDYVEHGSLTFIDEDPAHPEFLETEADYQKAPEGTIVACDDSPSWNKRDSLWQSVIACGHENAKCMSGIRRRVLRWGWGE